jgi:hypothetical protein
MPRFSENAEGGAMAKDANRARKIVMSFIAIIGGMNR